MSRKFELPDLANSSEAFSSQLSGRYTYNGGVTIYSEMSNADDTLMQGGAALNNPIYNLNQPIYIIDPHGNEDASRLRFTLHIDIDGVDPLNVVSGTITKGSYLTSNPTSHFIGRVTSNNPSGEGRKLIVEDFNFPWPGSAYIIDQLEIALTESAFTTPSAEVTLMAVGANKKYGPYSVEYESTHFREVEVEIDREDHAVDPEPYYTYAHPDHPADLPEENLTLENTFAKSGIRIIRSTESNVIRSSVSGPDKKWSNQELHDAMELHWSAFANRPQWKMWVFLAERAEDDDLGGIMFDAKIDEPEGIDRQGTAIFTRCPCFHSINGEYIQDNPPAAESVKRELFFNLIHETGHAFNLAHSFAKTRGGFWDAPAWIPPVTSNPKALSWMNYPDQASPGFNATWFYKRFRFRFDDNENLFLRHAPPQFVQMGSESWSQNHARVSRGSLDRRLELVVRSRKNSVELGEPILIEIRLRNVSDENVMVHCHLNPSDGFVELAVTKPNGERIPFIPIIQTRVHIQPFMLKPDQRLYHAVNLTVGGLGFPFKEPGPYRIEASYTNLDGSTTAALMQLWVRPPANYDDWPVISEFFNARVGRVLYIDGSRVMAEVRDKLKWISQHLGTRHPAQYHLAKVQNIPLAKSFKVIRVDTDKVDVLDSDPETVVQQLIPIIENAETAADTIGHIDYRKIVDIYTQSALLIKEEAEARKAQGILLGLFKNRNVIHHVIEAIEQRLKELK